MRRTLVVLLVLALAAGVAHMIWHGNGSGIAQRRGPEPDQSSAGLTIERIQGLSALTTLRVDVADAVATELLGTTGSVKAVLIVRGEFLVGVDLSAARFESIDKRTRSATLLLPQPRVQMFRLDHERTKLLGVWSTGLWTIVPGGGEADVVAVNAAHRDAQRIIEAAAEAPAVIERARVQTESALKVFFATLGWDVTISWDAAK